MIAQLLNLEFVAQRAEELLATLKEQATDGRRSSLPGELQEVLPELAELEPADYAAAHEMLSIGLELVAKDRGGGPQEAPAERRGNSLPQIDDFAFLSADPGLSLLQSALELCVDVLAPELAEERDLADDRRGGKGNGEVAVSGRSLVGYEPVASAEGRRVFDRFSQTDPRWMASLMAMGARLFRKPYLFPADPAPPRKIDDRARLVVVGDWGSGLPRARKVATQMRQILEQGIVEGRQQHVVHLGDVYYSGWAYEYRRRFLADWPVLENEAGLISSWNLNGNHDMYSGGHAYFGTSLADSRFAPYHQGSSHFSLSNDYWQILGLDTAYEDHGLAGDQAAWAQRLLNSSERKGLLLSHHQIFSSYEKSGPGSALARKIAPVLATGKVRSWFWGHEHRCVFYRPHAGVEQARCVGHGGVPVYMLHDEGDPIPAPGYYEYRRRFDQGGLKFERWATFGFAVLDFEGPKIKVRYIDEDGRGHQREILY